MLEEGVEHTFVFLCHVRAPMAISIKPDTIDVCLELKDDFGRAHYDPCASE